jgi:type IV fimbrial biogenesis protein FimT
MLKGQVNMQKAWQASPPRPGQVRHSSTAGCSPDGFTLLEALVVLALLATLVALAAPSLSGLRQKHQMQSQAEQMLGSLMLARSEALQRQQRVTLCVLGLGVVGGGCATEGSWAQGWLVFVDGNDNAVRDSTETVLMVHPALPPFLKLQGNATVNRYVSYGPEGRSQSISGGFQAGTLTLCAPGQNATWRLVINAVGKPRLESAVMPPDVAC